MEIAGNTVRTPNEHSMFFQPDWRYAIARGVGQSRTAPTEDGSSPQMRYYDYTPDTWVRRQVQYLDTEGNNKCANLNKNLKPHDPRWAVREANVTYLGDEPRREEDEEFTPLLKMRLEALLLCTDLTLSQIADYMNSTVAVIKAYERLFYNVRDDKGLMNAAPWLCEWFAKGNIPVVNHEQTNNWDVYWKVVAVEGGFKALLATWNGTLAPIGGEFPEVEMAQMMFRGLFRRMERNIRMGHMSQNALSQTLERFQAMIMDMRERGVMSKGERVSDESILMRLLGAMAPKVVVPSAERVASKQKEVEAKIEMMKQTERGHGSGKDTLTSIGAQVAAAKA